jgi:hypothetical protein
VVAEYAEPEPVEPEPSGEWVVHNDATWVRDGREWNAVVKSREV